MSVLTAPRRPRLSTGQVGAVVVGGDYQGLGIARSLGRAGVPVVVLDDETSISRVSRYVSRFVRADDLLDPDRTLDALRRLATTLGDQRWVLFPTREETVVAIAEHREELSTLFRVPTPGLPVVRTAWDKRETYRCAAALDIPVPRCWFPRTEADLDEVALDAPVVVKPAIKEHFIYATKVKAWRADDRDQLRATYRRARQVIPADEVIVQEMVPGDGASQLAYCAFFKDGAGRAEMTVRRLRQHPSDFGRASTYVETVDLPELGELARRMLAQMGYYGLVEVEFKRDSRDGVPKLLDINARTWGYHSLGVAAGVDFPLMLFRDQLGHDVPPASARAGVRWIRLETDLPNACRDVWRGRLKVRDYLRTLRGIDTGAVFSVSDPLPALFEAALTPYLAVRRGL
jgi:predicted ATP-grasp superfamily ATP-dependent carboligase